ncbi:hypothetical protein CVT24_000080, partial [Panaeolus cyanescens]
MLVPEVENGSSTSDNPLDDAQDVTMDSDDQSPPTCDVLYSNMPLDAWFQAGDSLFNLELSRYLRDSTYIEELYNDILQNHKAIQQAAHTPPIPGSLPTCPIVLNGVSDQTMRNFLEYLTVKWKWGATVDSNKYSEDETLDCISLAQRWGLTFLEQDLFDSLNLPSQSPALRLYASLKFKTNYLEQDDLRTLVFTPL